MGTGDLERKTRRLDQDVLALWDKLDEVTATQTAHSSRFDHVDAQLTRIKTTVQRQDSQFTEAFRDLDAIKMQQVLHGDQLARQADKLAHHDVQLARHTAVLDQHTATLDQHTAILDHHTNVLDQHTVMLQQLSSQMGQVLRLFGIDPEPGGA
jgi:chromosome segregation ATPase